MSRLRHEAGQTVVLLAVLLPLFLGLGAIAVDIGYWYVVKKTAQDAADAAALAAARELPNAAVAIPTGEDYVHRNMPDAVATVSTPYVEHTEGGGDIGVVTPPTSGTPDPMKIEVTVHQHAGTFFGRMFGVFDANVTARAVAERLPGDDTLAIFSNSDDCDDGLEFSGPRVRVNGHIHSNGQFRISVGPFWAADGTFDDDQCRATKDENALDVVFGSGPDFLPREGEWRPWPMWFTPQDFGWTNGCTYSAETIRIADGEVQLTGPDRSISYNEVLPRGTYCARESFVLDESDVRGVVTALAPAIEVNGADLHLSPYSQNMLFFEVPNTDNTPNDGPPPAELLCVPTDGSDMVLNGSGHRWFGVIFNPCGRTVVNLGGGEGGTPTLEGAIIGDRIDVVGDGFEMIGRGDFEYSTALVE